MFWDYLSGYSDSGFISPHSNLRDTLEIYPQSLQWALQSYEHIQEKQVEMVH